VIYEEIIQEELSSHSRQSRVSARPSERDLKEPGTISVEENPCEDEDATIEYQSQIGDSLALSGSIPKLSGCDIKLKSAISRSRK
jgi:hypothetical protein